MKMLRTAENIMCSMVGFNLEIHLQFLLRDDLSEWDKKMERIVMQNVTSRHGSTDYYKFAAKPGDILKTILVPYEGVTVIYP